MATHRFRQNPIQEIDHENHKYTLKLIRTISILTPFILLAFIGFVSLKNAAAQPKPNIIFIMADDLGYADLGSYGNTTIQTPNLDGLASQSMLFTEYHSNGSVCSPTRTALLTGQYQHRFGIRKVICVEYGRGIPQDVVTLPEFLKQSGYSTLHLGKWHVGSDRPEYLPLAKGYDQFIGFLHSRRKSYFDPWLLRNTQPEQFMGYLTDILTDQAVQYIESQHDKPFFINLWYFAPHLPLEPHPRWADEYPSNDEGKYAAMVSTLDENIGRILRAVDSAGIGDNTLIIFTSDNGGIELTHPDGNGPLQGYKSELFQGGIKVPLIINWPGHIPAGTSNSSLVTTVDFLPTVADIVGTDSPPTDGRSFVSALLGNAHLDKPLSFWENISGGAYTFAVREDNWKLLHHESYDYLFDILVDPNETTNLAAANGDIVQELTQKHTDWRRQVSLIDYKLSELDKIYGSSGILHFGHPDSVAVIYHQARFDIACCEASFGLWIYPTAIPGAGSTLLAKGDNWSFDLNPDKTVTASFITTGEPISITSTSQTSFNEWNHIALTRKIGQLDLYIDGKLDVSEINSDTTVLNSDYHITIGNTATVDQAFHGWIKKPVFYNTALSPLDIVWLYDQKPAPIGTDETALAVAKSAVPEPVRTGAPLTYTIRITNTSQIDQHATITEQLPLHIAPGQTADGGLIVPGGVLTWTPTISAPDGVWTATFVVTTEPGFAGALPNVLHVTSEQGVAGVFTTTSHVVIRPPYAPSNPNPADHATGTTLSETLHWQGGDPDGDPVTYTVAFGATHPPPVVGTGVTETTYAPGPLAAHTTYYWTVTATDWISETAGPTWQFTTLNHAPDKPALVAPPDSAEGVPLTQTLRWQAEDPDGDPVTYTVGIGIEGPPKVIGVTALTHYTPTLQPKRTYYWSITATDGFSVSVGPVWHFVTEIIYPYKLYLPLVVREE